MKQPVTVQLKPVRTIIDLVITAHPQSPPLSLFVISRMLADQRRVLLTNFVHSSAKHLTGQHLLNTFQNHGHMVADRNSFEIGITVIWKDGKQVFVCLPVRFCVFKILWIDKTSQRSFLFAFLGHRAYAYG